MKRNLIEASLAISRSKDTYLSGLYHRIARRRGKQKATVATCHAILVMVYHIITKKLPYRESGADFFDRLNETYIKHNFIRRLQSLGYEVTLKPLAASIAQRSLIF